VCKAACFYRRVLAVSWLDAIVIR